MKIGLIIAIVSQPPVAVAQLDSFRHPTASVA